MIIKKYRIKTWKEGYFIYYDKGWFNESGTKVSISGWNSVLDKFEEIKD